MKHMYWSVCTSFVTDCVYECILSQLTIVAQLSLTRVLLPCVSIVVLKQVGEDVVGIYIACLEQSISINAHYYERLGRM